MRSLQHLISILFLMAAALLVALPAFAQEAPGEQSDALLLPAPAEDLFTRATNALEQGIVSVRTLELLRGQLVDVRDQNAAVVNRGSVKADALQAQLNALGPVPQDGQKEADDVAARRVELVNAVADANAPVVRAREIQFRAAALIHEVDRQIRSRGFDQMLERYPSPVFPSTWVEGLSQIQQFHRRLVRDVESQLARPSVSKSLGQTVPLSIGLFVFGLAFIFWLRFPIHRYLLKLSLRQERGFPVILTAVLYNLSYLVLPAIGLTAMLSVIWILDIQPNAARTALIATPASALAIVTAMWLGHTLFAPEQTRWRLLDLDEKYAKRGLWLCLGLGIFMMFEITLESLQMDDAFGQAALSLISLPVITAASLFLWLLAGVLRSHDRHRDPEPALPLEVEDDEDPEAEEASVNPRDSGFLFFMSLLMKASAVLAFTVTLAGYVLMARVAVIPMIMTIAQLGFGFMLYHLALAVVRTATKRDETEPVPILVSLGLIFALVVTFAPLIALTWGARATDVMDAWRLLLAGIQLGDIRLSLDSILVLLVVFGVGLFVTRWLKNLLRTSVLPQTRMDIGAQTAIVTGTGYVGLTLAVLIAVSTAGLNLSSLAVVAGALSVGIGFGLQTIVSNFVSGIILLVERPIKEGDWIEVSGQTGYVRKISVRSTRIETFDRHDVIIPNSDLIAGTVRNMTLSNKTGRLVLPVRVAYGSDLEAVKAILMNAARAHYTIARYPHPFVLFVGLGESSLNFELRCYLKDVNNILTTQSDLYFTIYNELGKAGIEIPFPQQDVHFKDIDKFVSALEKREEAGGTPAAS
ncbi:mechanosensitive ion channel family protein [Roseibium denhamense]|uniref:DUF3772 domain-containing protein n=1 Tax=Roseibium denhamense TaxID=76305 RepID=UPI0012BC07A9|nr:DUF3772 domain-containing protein [Roseibium denhamense]MTI05978.1 mechanosensitive ion channel family protein [Roseibium denhamense]